MTLPNKIASDVSTKQAPRTNYTSTIFARTYTIIIFECYTPVRQFLRNLLYTLHFEMTHEDVSNQIYYTFNLLKITVRTESYRLGRCYNLLRLVTVKKTKDLVTGVTGKWAVGRGARAG
jgi:hypothetical protein